MAMVERASHAFDFTFCMSTFSLQSWQGVFFIYHIYICSKHRLFQKRKSRYNRYTFKLAIAKAEKSNTHGHIAGRHLEYNVLNTVHVK